MLIDFTDALCALFTGLVRVFCELTDFTDALVHYLQDL